MRKLTLSNGIYYELDWCNGDRGIFYANIITDAPFLELATRFSNPDLTSLIKASYGEEIEETYKGYTELKSIVYDSWRTGTVMITLTIPEGNPNTIT